ncbi:MAG: hypothetical protein A3I62_02895 [Betaproteobacteria bacterium RIFCSPLOWO2_02_FULL_62_79]|nr:MAG: hypothetical protein A3I62_02895 [Betaproteobacteria bacterium RIFCSPLOWO2_02_FULL_62_79]
MSMKFDVRYRLVAVVFVPVAVEIALLLPREIVRQEIGVFGFISMMLSVWWLASSMNGRTVLWNGGSLGVTYGRT